MRREALSKHAHRLAQVGICVQFLALIRTLAEFFRLEHVEGAALRIATALPSPSSVRQFWRSLR